MSEKHKQTLKLPDGRKLGFAEFGDLNGQTVFYFTGGNNSRLEAKSYDTAAQKLGLRIISIDRPGFGNSDFLAGRQFLDWPADVVQLADYLEVARFPVFGLSGGGPHLLAMAYQQPDRITRGRWSVEQLRMHLKGPLKVCGRLSVSCTPWGAGCR